MCQQCDLDLFFDAFCDDERCFLQSVFLHQNAIKSAF
jgi:hypothetical protein